MHEASTHLKHCLTAAAAAASDTDFEGELPDPLPKMENFDEFLISTGQYEWYYGE